MGIYIFVTMKKCFLGVSFLVLILIACKQKNEKLVGDSKELSKYTSAKDLVKEFDSLPSVVLKYKDSVEGWKGYQEVRLTMQSFKKTTANEVLINTVKLVKEIELMRDSFDRPELKVRGMLSIINGLHNQALSLQEMGEISAITIEEISHQTQGLFVLFNMVDKKINAIYDQLDFENKMLQDEFEFSLKDSIF